MKYAGIVLRNTKNPLSAVEYEAVHDALLSGGVFLGEFVFLGYDAPSELVSAISRLSLESDAVVLVCDSILNTAAKNAVFSVTGEEFTEEYFLETARCLFAVLPDGESGAQVVEKELIPLINRRRNNSYSRVVMRAVSAPAERFDEALSRAREAAQGKLLIHAREKFGALRIEAIYDSATPKMIADEVVRILASGLHDYIYALEDVSIAEQLVAVLKLHKKHVATAESFTAGGVGRAIVRVPGASSVFYEGINAYDPKAKKERLGVSEYTLKSKGAVSDETAYEMAAGLIAQGNCDLAIATTGNAGPLSSGADTPVGLCFIAIGTKERVRVFRYRLSGSRETVTETAINLALFLAYQEIK